MTSTRFDYAALDRQAERRQLTWRVVVVAGVLLGAIFVLYSTPVARWERRIDPVTGSIKRQRIWIGGIASSEQIEPSPLETRLRQSQITWNASWQLLNIGHTNLFGDTLGFGCARAPPIYSLCYTMDRFVAASTDEQLREFVHTMESGTAAERQAAVDAAWIHEP